MRNDLISRNRADIMAQIASLMKAKKEYAATKTVRSVVEVNGIRVELVATGDGKIQTDQCTGVPQEYLGPLVLALEGIFNQCNDLLKIEGITT